MSKKVIYYFAGFLFLLNIVVWQEVFALAGPKYLKVDFLSVGQGDSEFIQTPEGHQILIDGGPDATLLGKLAKNMPFWDKTIDLVILTHPESDHMQGLLYALKSYKADYILWSGVKKTAPEYTEWMNVLARQEKLGAKIIIAKAGQEISAPGGPALGGKAVLIDILYPFESLQGKELKASANDTCVVAKIIFGKDSFIFTGDIDTKAEKELANSGPASPSQGGENILKADVLKIAHHGSKYSTSDLFLSAVSPAVAVIEVGKNSYGHPTSEVLNRLEKSGIKVLRTDKDGDVEFVSDGNNIKLKK